MNQIGNIINLGIGLILIWILFYAGWRPYRLDRVRQQLFEIRNELFLYAMDGNVAFSDPAYSKLRTRINALIRFAETITFTRVIIFAFQDTLCPNPAFHKQQTEWEASLSRIPLEKRKVLVKFDDRVGKTLAIHLVKGSPLLVAILPFYLVARKLKALIDTQQEDPRVTTFARDLRVELLEEQAVLAQKEEMYELAHA